MVDETGGDKVGDLVNVLKRAKPAADADPDKPGGDDKAVRIGKVSGQGNQVVIGSGNVIINDTRRPGERIDDDQLRELRDRIESLSKIDALLASRNPRDERPHAQRLDSARRKRWHQLRDAFHLKSYTHLTNGQYDDALLWIDQQKQAALSTIGLHVKKRGTRTRPPARALRLVCLFLLALCVPLLFSVSQTRTPNPMIAGPIAAITADQAPAIQPAGLVDQVMQATEPPCQPYFECHAGCSFFKPANPISPMTTSNPQAI